MMIRKPTIFLFALIAIPCLLQAQSSNGSLAQRADSLYAAFEERQALEAYKQILAQDSTNFEALWKTSFLYSRIGNRLEGKENQRDYYNRAIELAEEALAMDSAHTQSNFVMAVAMGRKALIAGARDRVAASREIKKYADRAIRADSANAGAWHVLGRWNFKVANLSFVERLAANTLFGGIPGDASNRKAADALERAIRLDPKYVLYYHDLAMIYEEMGNKQKAIAACREAIRRPNVTPDDERLKAECRRWIEEWR